MSAPRLLSRWRVAHVLTSPQLGDTKTQDSDTIMAPGLRGDFAEDCKLENYYICPDPLCSDDIWLALNDYTLSYNRQLDEKMIIFFCKADGRFV